MAVERVLDYVGTVAPSVSITYSPAIYYFTNKEVQNE